MLQFFVQLLAIPLGFSLLITLLFGSACYIFYNKAQLTILSYKRFQKRQQKDHFGKLRIGHTTCRSTDEAIAELKRRAANALAYKQKYLAWMTHIDFDVCEPEVQKLQAILMDLQTS